MHAILTETLACFLPGRAKDLTASLYYRPLADGQHSMKHVAEFMCADNL